MPKSDTQDTPPDWMDEERARSGKRGGKPVNKSFSAPKKAKPVSTSKPKIGPVQRGLKGFYPETSRARKWDKLVAAMKNSVINKKTGPELIDEALDDLFKKYVKELKN